MRRRGPRPISAALESIGRTVAPPTLLASVQAAWPDAVGAAIAAEAQPIAEREGTVTIACSSAAWANELELLAPDLLEKLRGALAADEADRLRALRTRVAKLP